MSTQTRKYELKARAESQRETRDRIASVAAGLHEEKGVAQTTVSEIARRAGVSRLTVYNHFPDLGELLPACAAHYQTAHPFPDLGAGLAQADPDKRLADALARMYAWYRENEPMYGKLFGDRALVPELDRFMTGTIDSMLSELADDLGAGFRARGRRAERVHALIRLALDFWTWRRLSLEGFGDDVAADVMTTAVATHAAA